MSPIEISLHSTCVISEVNNVDCMGAGTGGGVWGVANPWQNNGGVLIS